MKLLSLFIDSTMEAMSKEVWKGEEDCKNQIQLMTTVKQCFFIQQGSFKNEIIGIEIVSKAKSCAS